MIERLKQNWSSFSVKKRQQILGVTISTFIITLIFLVIVNAVPKKAPKISDQPNFAGISESKSNIEDIWLVESQDKFKQLNAKLKEKDGRLKKLSKKYDDLESRFDSFSDNGQTDDLRKEVAQLRKQIDSNPRKQAVPKRKASLAPNNNYSGSEPFSKAGVRSRNYDDYNKNSVPETRGIMMLDFSNDGEKNSYDLSNYLPAGSYVKAVLISAVDASVGLSSQSDPRPVLFRILAEAKSAKNDNKQLTTNIKGCTITGAASGDLSSERAYIRLLKMTCSKGNKVIETSIEGYAADGVDGKAGIAGKVVSREGDLITKSFLAGAVSGIGKAAAQKFYPSVNLSSGFTANNDISNKDIAAMGLSEGISQSSKNVAQYLIDRAEQYQPVISVASGKEVELVFISGTYLDGRIITGQDESGKSNQLNKNFIK